jgi:hypothetical protein
VGSRTVLGSVKKRTISCPCRKSDLNLARSPLIKILSYPTLRDNKSQRSVCLQVSSITKAHRQKRWHIRNTEVNFED